MSRAWCKVGLKNVPAALALLDQFAVDKMREFETMLVLNADLDPDDVDVVIEAQQQALDTWIAGVRAEVVCGVADLSERGAHR